MLDQLEPSWTWLATLGGDWLLTYLAHSTLLFLGTALWLRLRPSSLAVQERLWRFALIGGLLTASIQGGLGIEPLIGHFAPPARAAQVAAALEPAAEASMAQPSSTVAMTTSRPDAATTVSGDVGPAGLGGAAVPTVGLPSVGEAALRGLPELAVATWALAALALLLWLGIAQLRIRSLLRGRRSVTDESLWRRFADLQRRLGLDRPVAFTVSAKLPSPISHGVVRPEVVLPLRALDELNAHELEAVLAHELSHLARRDPLWQLALRALESVFFVQPCNRVVRRRLGRIAELRCDESAARLTGRPLDLARSLTQVASWGTGAPALAAVAFAARRSHLGSRVERLLAGPSREVTRGGWLLPVLLLSAIAVAAAPSASLSPKQQPPGVSAPPAEAPLPVPPEELPAPPATTAPAAPAPESVPMPSPTLSSTPSLRPTPRAGPSLPVATRIALVPTPPNATIVWRSALTASAPAPRPQREPRHRDLAAALDEAARALSSSEASQKEVEAVLRTLQRHLDLALANSSTDEGRARLAEARALERRQRAEARHPAAQALIERLAAQQAKEQQRVEVQLRRLAEVQAAREQEARAQLESLIEARNEQRQQSDVETQRRAEALQQQLLERQRQSDSAAEALQQAYELRLRKLEEEYQALLQRLEERERTASEPPPAP